jgi:membrane protein
MAEEHKLGLAAFVADVGEGMDHHNGGQMSGSIAFFFALSIAPLIIVVAILGAALLGRQVTAGLMIGHLSPIIGAQGTRGLQSAVRVTVESTSNGLLAIITAVIGTVFGAGGAVVQMRTSLNVILGKRADTALRGAARDWLTAVGAVVVIAIAGVVLIGSWAVSGAMGGSAKTPAEVLATGAVYFFLLTLAYLRLPSRRPPLRASLIGSAVATLVAAGASVGMGIYLGSGFAASSYGTAASFFLFLMWLWITATGFIVGAETVRVLAEKRCGPDVGAGG